jgi:hypothetical protein
MLEEACTLHLAGYKFPQSEGKKDKISTLCVLVAPDNIGAD